MLSFTNHELRGLISVILLSRYALGIDLPDFVAEHPVIEALNQFTNDLVTWSNVSHDPRTDV